MSPDATRLPPGPQSSMEGLLDLQAVPAVLPLRVEKLEKSSPGRSLSDMRKKVQHDFVLGEGGVAVLIQHNRKIARSRHASGDNWLWASMAANHANCSRQDVASHLSVN